MKFQDLFIFSSYSGVSQKMRSFLTSLGIAIGVVCVIFLQILKIQISVDFCKLFSNGSVFNFSKSRIKVSGLHDM